MSGSGRGATTRSSESGMRAAPAFVVEVNRLTYRRCFRSRGESRFCFCSTIPGDDDILVSVFTSRFKASLCTNVMSRVSGRLANESAEPEERETPPLMPMLERRARFFPHLAVVRLQDGSDRGQLRLCLRLCRNCATVAVVPVVPVSRDRGGWLSDKHSCPACLFDAICCFPEGAERCVQQSVHSSSKP